MEKDSNQSCINKAAMRLGTAMTRSPELEPYFSHTPGGATRYLLVKKPLDNRIIDLQKLMYLEAQGKHSLLQLDTGEQEQHHKSLDQMQQLLPPYFERMHKSFIVNMELVSELKIMPGSRYTLAMQNGVHVPVGRVHYNRLKERFI